MKRSTHPRRAAAIAVALLGVLLLGLNPAHAALLAHAANESPTSVSSGTFAVVPTLLPTTPPPGPLVLTFPLGLAPAPQYFEAVNTGSIALVGASYGVALTSTWGSATTA